MQIIPAISEMQAHAISLRTQGKLIGLVPTMGALHEGHLQLIDVAKQKADVVIVSIFVNPTQFGPSEDFSKYPRSFETDVEACEKRGANIVFAPKKDDIYPPGYSTYVSEERISKGLCGISRPGHFRGVCTVVNLLFNITRPDFAVFGQKDAQQAAVIKKMVADLWLPVEVVVAPTVRERDGLALSSRNKYLTPEQRAQASILFHALAASRLAVKRQPVPASRLRSDLRAFLSVAPLVRLDYVEFFDPVTLQPVTQVRPGSHMALAVYFGRTRLIDNASL